MDADEHIADLQEQLLNTWLILRRENLCKFLLIEIIRKYLCTKSLLHFKANLDRPSYN